MTNPATAFDDSANKIDYAAVAKTVLTLKPRALTVSQFEDVLALMEWMQGECAAMHEFNSKREAELDHREREISKREKELRIRSRAVDVARMTKTSGSKFGGYFGGYFGR